MENDTGSRPLFTKLEEHAREWFGNMAGYNQSESLVNFYDRILLSEMIAR